MIRAPAALALALLGGTAHADGAATPAPPAKPAPKPEPPKPERAALDAGEDANLESIARPQGVVVTLSGGFGLSVGVSMDNATGQGSANTLRLAHVATPRSTLMLEIIYNTLVFLPNGSDIYTTHSFDALLGGQYYLNPAVWLRGAAGAGVFVGEGFVEDGLTLRPEFSRFGPAFSVGAGVDMRRGKLIRLTAEICSTALYNGEGVLVSNSLLFGVGFD